MERLEGESLASVLEREGRLAVSRAVELGLQLCHALGAAHAAGFVHRDLKPENVFLARRAEQRDVVKVLDFGIAQSSHDLGPRLTRPGFMMGTPEYMAPEQAFGFATDERTDVHALGIVLYEMLTGSTPHAADSPMEVIAKRVARPPTLVRARRAEVPVVLEEAVMCCLEREPQLRPSSMRALAARLEAARDELYLRGTPAPAPTVPATTPAEPRLKGLTQRLVAALGLGALLVGFGLAAAWAAQDPREPPSPPAPASIARSTPSS